MRDDPTSGARQRFDRAKQIFLEVCGAPLDQQTLRAAEACQGDPRLLADVRVLLHADRSRGLPSADSTTTPLGDVPLGDEFAETVPLAPTPSAGDRIHVEDLPELEDTEHVHNHRLLDLIAQGGMGRVYLAAQTHPIQRLVALKLVRPGHGDFVARFEVERQALALMDHPGIARVYDAGETSSGAPYFTMEFVPGAPITLFCDSNNFSIEARLQLFVALCEAVQHAHQKGILHRDLKPSNVLVREVEGRPVPKVVDFGLAKALDFELGAQQLTQADHAIGTPEYMSLEQLRGETLDTAADVFALGVILHELLVGCRPIPPQMLPKGWNAAAPVLMHFEAMPASQRIGHETPESLAQIATTRQLDVSMLKRQLVGDLDGILLKALERDRRHRYGSANQLARDVQAYLDFEPVTASPPTTFYLIRKFVRRNQKKVAAATAFLLIIVVALVVSTYLWIDAETKNRAVTRLSAQKSLKRYSLDAEQWWPATPVMAPKISALLTRVNSQLADLDEYRDSLETLRRALPPQQGESLARLRSQARTLEKSDTPDASTTLDEIQRQIAAVETGFGNAESAWVDELLSELIASLEDAQGPRGLQLQLRWRLDWSNNITQRSFDDHAETWQEALTHIADPRVCPDYHGLQLERQLGLVPLGQDPDSLLWEFAHIMSGNIPQRLADRPLPAPQPGDAVVLVLLPGGEFTMGSVAEDKEAQSIEQPAHVVTIAPFFLAKYELTKAQWTRWTGRDPSMYPAGKGFQKDELGAYQEVVQLTNPVENVSWLEARRVTWQMGLALPTEAQWEYAARAGTRFIWYPGSDMGSMRGYVNLADRASQRAGATWTPWDNDDGFACHAPVGSFKPNRLGLYNMLGNVWEWCLDERGPYTHPARAITGERIPSDDSQGQRALRGGGYMAGPSWARCSYRYFYPPEAISGDTGLRPARPIEGEWTQRKSD